MAPAAPSQQDLAKWAERFDVAVPRSISEAGLRRGVSLGGHGIARIAVGPDGSREVRLAETADTRQQIGSEQAVKTAQRAIEQYRLAENVDLILDNVRFDRHAGASADERVDESVREITVNYVQVIDGIPVVSPDGGRVQIRVDNEGTVTGIADSTRPVRDLRDHPATPAQPDTRVTRSPKASAAARPGEEVENGTSAASSAVLDDLLDAALQRRLRRAASGGRAPSGIRTVPGTTEVGYALRDGDAVLVARREVEFDFGRGLAKRYVLEEPITG
jgi:hypothetical protein